MIPTYDFITALKFAKHAAGKKSVRYYLNGVLFRFGSDFLELVATDGHRIAKICLKVNDCLLEGDYIVKNESVKAVLGSVKTKQGDPARVLLKKGPLPGLISLISETVSLTLETIDSKYPAFERTLPSADPIGAPTIGINSEYLAEAALAFKSLTNAKYQALAIDTWDAGRGMRLRSVPDTPRLSAIRGEVIVYIMPIRL